MFTSDPKPAAGDYGCTNGVGKNVWTLHAELGTYPGDLSAGEDNPLVIGVMTERGILGGFFDDIIYVPLTTGQLHLFGGNPDLHTVVVQAANPYQVDFTDKAVRALMRKRHQSDDFDVYNMTEEIKRSARTQDTLAKLLGAIAAISLMTGGIGVMNVMSVPQLSMTLVLT